MFKICNSLLLDLVTVVRNINKLTCPKRILGMGGQRGDLWIKTMYSDIFGLFCIWLGTNAACGSLSFSPLISCNLFIFIITEKKKNWKGHKRGGCDGGSSGAQYRKCQFIWLSRWYRSKKTCHHTHSLLQNNVWQVTCRSELAGTSSSVVIGDEDAGCVLWWITQVCIGSICGDNLTAKVSLYMFYP